jgi:hypothetical protein
VEDGRCVVCAAAVSGVSGQKYTYLRGVAALQGPSQSAEFRDILQLNYYTVLAMVSVDSFALSRYKSLGDVIDK